MVRISHSSEVEKCFELFYGDIEDYAIIALLPSYKREHSSLVYMVNEWIKKTNHPLSGFYLDDLKGLKATHLKLENKGQKNILLGVLNYTHFVDYWMI